MRKIFTLAIALVLSITALKAQMVAAFDTLSLPGTDTFYVDYSNPGSDVGFTEANLHFPCYYDTSFGGIWSGGFAYSNMTDLTDSSFNNLYTAVTGIGFDTSSQYCVVSAFDPVVVSKAQKNEIQAFTSLYITNTLYAYKEMSEGGFGKKFGGATGNDPDWFKLTIRGYKNGTMLNDSVEFYLADFRDSDGTKDYIVDSWKQVNINSLGLADSLQFTLSSSDTAGGFGMNNPAFFAIDNFETYLTHNVDDVWSYSAKVYPNPAVNELNVEFNNNGSHTLSVWDISGKLIAKQETTTTKVSVNTSSFIPGMYILRIKSEQGSASVKFTKQ